jgi:HSP20 family protein
MFDILPWRKSKTSVSNTDNSIDNFRREADQLLNRFFEMPAWGENLSPKVDIIDKKKTIEVKAEIPGMDVNDLDISLNGQYLTLSGNKKEEVNKSKGDYYHVESSYGSFSRTVQLPSEVDQSDVDASYKKGILKIELKKTRLENSKRIKIEAKD